MNDMMRKKVTVSTHAMGRETATVEGVRGKEGGRERERETLIRSVLIHYFKENIVLGTPIKAVTKFNLSNSKSTCVC